MERKHMAMKNIANVLHLAESLKDGESLEITGVEFGSDDTGKFVRIDCGEKVYRTYSKVVYQQLEDAIRKEKFDFKKDSLAVSVVERVSEKTGRTYLALA